MEKGGGVGLTAASGWGCGKGRGGIDWGVTLGSEADSWCLSGWICRLEFVGFMVFRNAKWKCKCLKDNWWWHLPFGILFQFRRPGCRTWFELRHLTSVRVTMTRVFSLIYFIHFIVSDLERVERVDWSLFVTEWVVRTTHGSNDANNILTQCHSGGSSLICF